MTEQLRHGLDRLRGHILVLRGQADRHESFASFMRPSSYKIRRIERAARLRREADALEAVYQKASQELERTGP